MTTQAEAEAAGGGPSSRKLFLGGIFWETSEAKLRQHFSKYGEVEEVIVMRDRHTGQPRGFGFVTFKTQESAEEACKEPHLIDGRTIEAKPSIPQCESQKPRSRKIFVGGLAPDTTEDMFKEYFESYGKVAEAQIMMDQTSGRSRGFGFVTFEEDGIVAKVFEAGSIHELGGKKVEVKSATPKGSGPVGSRLALVAPAGGLGGAAIMGGGASYLTGTGAYVPMAPGHGFGAYSSTPGAMGAQAAAAAAAYGYGMAGPAAGYMAMQSGSGYGMAPQYAYPGGMMMPAGAAGYGASAGGYGGPRQGGAGYPAGAGAYGGGAMAANPLSRSGSGVDATAYATAAYTGQQQDAAKQFSGRGGGARRGAQVQQQVQQQQQ